jgi:hypothetical protein
MKRDNVGKITKFLPPKEQEELYNIKEDIGERKDLANSNIVKRDELLDGLLAWHKSVSAPLPDQQQRGSPHSHGVLISAQATEVSDVFLAGNESETIDLLDVIKTTAKLCPDTISSSSSPPSPPSCIRPACRDERPSPTNRDKFLAGLHVQSLGCSLDACTAGPTVRLTFTGTIVVLYPINFNPDRRYVVFMDENGFTGITIWSSNLKKIAANSIGKLCEISKVNISSHQGKKTINLSKESEVSNDVLPNLLLTYVSRSQSKTKVCGGHLCFANPLLPSWTYIRCPNTQSYPSLEFLATCVLKKKLSKLKPKGF